MGYKKLKDLLQYEQPTKYIVENTEYNNNYETPVLTAGQTFILGYTNEKENIFSKEKLPVIIFDDFTTATKFVDFPFKVKSSAMKILLPIGNDNLKYIFYAIQNLKFDCTTHKRYWISEFSNLEIYVPSLKEQNEIVRKLDRIKQLEEKNKKQLELLNELAKSQFIKMFGNPIYNENNYDFIAFENFMDRCVDIGSNGANKVVVEHLDMKDTEDYALLVRTLNFTANDFEKNVKYISKEAYEFFSKSKVFGGEIIFNKIGSAGINFLMPMLNRPVSLGLNQIMVTPKDINTRYLYDYLNSEYGKFQINSRVNGAVTKTIQKTELKKIPIMNPPIELQSEYEKIVKCIDNQKINYENNLKKLEELKSNLMNKYFN